MLLSSLHDFIEFPFLQNALIATIFLSISLGVISPFVIARRYAYIGSAISHSTLLGLSIGLIFFSLTDTNAIFLSMLLTTLIPVSFLAYATYKESLPSDSIIGIFLSATMAMAIIIYSLFAKERGDLMGLLFGNILFIDSSDLFLIILITILTLAIILIPLKKWLYLITDFEGATISGVKVRLLHFTFIYMLTILIISSIKIAGPVLVDSFLLLPGFFALKISRSIKETLRNSLLFSLVTSISGLFLANLFSLPSGAIITIIQFLALSSTIVIIQIKRGSLR